jgi:hypothetical protein
MTSFVFPDLFDSLHPARFEDAGGFCGGEP